MRSKISAFTLFLFASCLVPSLSFATTVEMTLDSTAGGIYPYGFSIDDSPTLTNLSCINSSRTVNLGETWTATALNLGTLVSNKSNTLYTVIDNATPSQPVTLGDLEVDANLFTKYIKKPSDPNYTLNNTEVQDAIWSVLNGSYVYTGLSGSTQQHAVQNLITNAVNVVSGSGNETSSFYSAFTFYIPQTWGTTDDYDRSGTIPQQFLGYCPVTPEPSSLILLGTGLAGLAGAVRRRMSSARQQSAEL